MKTSRIRNQSLACLVCILFPPCFAEAATVTNTVQGTSNPWLAGMVNGASASCGDAAPAQSPSQVVGLPIIPGDLINFRADGGVGLGPGYPLAAPDGDPSFPIRLPGHDVGAENGLPDCRAPYDSLIGVFLGSGTPDVSPAPAALDFSTQLKQDYVTLKPGLKQVFFIGDGLTSNGTLQQVIVPAGATRLFLGTMDGCGWNNNPGSFTVAVTENNPPSYLTIDLYPGITIQGTVGSTNRIEFVSDVGATNWTVLTNLVLPSSPFLFIDAQVPLSIRRFYRTVELP